MVKKSIWLCEKSKPETPILLDVSSFD